MERSVGGVGVLDKCVVVFDALIDGPLALAGLVETTGLSRATAFRLAQALVAHGLVRRDGEGRFALGGRLIELGRHAEASFGLVESALAYLRALRDATGESTQLYVPHGGSRLCLVALDSPHELRTIVAQGAVLPLGRGSAGRVLAGADLGASGWIESVEEREPGVASVSAPVVGPTGDLVAAVSVSGPLDRISRSPGRRHGAAVVAAASAISAAFPAF